MNQSDIQNSDLFEEINNLSISEKILLVENIWDSILLDNEKLELTENQKKELDKRYLDYKKKPETGSSWKDVKKRIKSRL